MDMDSLAILVKAILSLKDTTDSKKQIASELPKLEKQLQSDKNTKVKIIAGLDITKSKNLIQSQLNTITNQAKAPTIQVGIEIGNNYNNARNIVSGLENIQVQAEQTKSSLLELTSDKLRRITFDIGNDGNNFNLEKTKENFKKAISEVGDFDKIELSWSFDENNMTGDIKSITATITDANNITESFTFNLEKLEQQFSYVSGAGTDKGMIQLLEKERLENEKVIEAIEKKRIATIKAREEEEKKVQSNQNVAINKALEDEWKKVNEEVVEYNEELDRVTRTWKEQDLYTENAENAINELKNSLSQVGSKDGMSSWVSEYENKILNLNTNLKEQVKIQEEIYSLEIKKAKLNPRDNNSFVKAEYEKQIKEKQAELKVHKDIAETYNDIIPLAQQEQYIIKETTKSAQALLIAKSKQKDKNQIVSEKDLLQVEVLISRIEAFRKANPKAEKQFSKTFDGMIDDLRKMPTSWQKVQKQFQVFENEAKASGLIGNTFFGSIKSNIEKFSSWMTLTGVISGLWREMKQMVTNVIELDNSLLELSKVSDLSASGLKKVAKEAYELGKEVGKTGTQVIDAITNFKRAGFDLEKSTSLAKDALILTNVAEGINEASDAATALISIMKGYGDVSSEFSQKILDAINEVSNTQAINFDDLVDGSQRLSAVANQAGASFEQMLGVLTGTNEIMQNIEKTAAGQITIFTRLQSIQLPDEEDVMPIAKLQDTISTATKGAVSIVDSTTGELRNVYDILDDINEVWDTLDKNTQEGIAFAAAGTRQKNVFLSMMENWENVEKATNSAMDSAGSAIVENQKYLDSIQGKMANFESSFQSLSNTVIESDFIKVLIDGGTTLLNLLDSIFQKFGTIPTVLTSIAAIGSFKNVGGTNKTRPFLYNHNFICIENETRFKIRLSNCWDDYAKAL